MPVDLHPDWLIPEWPAPPGVRAVFTTRAGGVSPAPYDSMNLGEHVGDRASLVAANRDALRLAMGCRPVFLQQVHGREVLELDHDTDQGRVGDASVTRQRGLACTIMVADCLPVLFAHLDLPVVAAAHAGWRGLAGVGGPDSAADPQASGGVLEAVFLRFAALLGSCPAEVATRTIAWLGPCIGPSEFEVGAEVKAAFEAANPAAGAFFAPRTSQVLGAASLVTAAGSAQWVAANASHAKYACDLPGLARLKLRALGIHQLFGNDGGAAWCTVSQPSRFFSHRRDAGGGLSTGRMAACIWRV